LIGIPPVPQRHDLEPARHQRRLAVVRLDDRDDLDRGEAEVVGIAIDRAALAQRGPRVRDHEASRR